MAVAIRLRREGNRNRAFYRIVVADSRARREGRFIEMIGTYDPNKDGQNFQVDIAKADDWISKGAQPSDTVRSILKKARRNPAPAAEEAPAKAEKAPAAKAEPAPQPKKEEEKPAPTPEPEEAKAEEAPAKDAAASEEKAD